MPKLVEKTGSRPPWVGLAAAVWVQMSAGNASTFPLYSAALKLVLGFNQQQVTLLGVACDLGENMGLLPGYASNKLAPWAMLLIGVSSCFLGYGVLWLSVSQIVNGLPFWLSPRRLLASDPRPNVLGEALPCLPNRDQDSRNRTSGERRRFLVPPSELEDLEAVFGDGDSHALEKLVVEVRDVFEFEPVVGEG
ncbi:hypothetical protein F2Q68_00045301 [Brassica cretica]|uniref:Nodulin-like domain-containing protein n=1 Tax=Brassica cretica TaxID=69181 RepID=A0A8S9LRV5_BRACR|nr:hypothetical protein F2Q68_00045301 [Brassica cretica]